MPQFTSYNQHKLKILEPLGGPDFVERVVKTIRTADAAAYNDCQTIFLDSAHCDALGEVRRAKINDALVGFAATMGFDCSYEKPGRQRYHNLVMCANGAVLTVAKEGS